MANHFGYSDTLMDHFDHPRNAGEMKAPDAIGSAGDGAHDRTTFCLRIEKDVIRDIRFKCVGCPPAIAAASMTSHIAKGKHLDDAAEITQDTIVTALGGMPADKRHVAALAAEALANAIMNYVTRDIERSDGDTRPQSPP